VDSCEKKWQENEAYQELIHIPTRLVKSIINHNGSGRHQGTPENQLTVNLPGERKFAIILGFAQS
jgi:hypothetical protein